VFAVNAGLDPVRISHTVETMQQFQIVTGAVPDAAALLDRGPMTSVIAELGAWTGDPRWH
jgi:hypothetical protein